MKKAALTTAILTALVSAPSFAATVYKNDGTELKVGGRVEFRGDFIGSDGAEVEGSMEDKSRARLNLKGKTDIGNGLSAFGVYEAEQKTGKSEFKNRYMYAGVDSDIGAFSVGRQDMAAVIISDMTDITEFSGVQQVIDSSSDKQDSVFAYRGALMHYNFKQPTKQTLAITKINTASLECTHYQWASTLVLHTLVAM